ncbi:MAG TPA: hypothetical protein VFW00_14525 [Rhodocyclaceae bacterium]|nr:hypothetical protein [Rhodocyclaceae bacterium]
MKRLLFATALVALAGPVIAADVGVSISVGQPGFFGRIDLGSEPPPQVIYRQPVIVEKGPAVVERQPVYLHVPPSHARNWGRYCHQYNACGERVYFVKDTWYNNVYVPHHRHDHDHDRDHDRDHDHDHDRGPDDRFHGDDHHDHGPDRDHDRDYDRR